ncbi:MAG: glycosyltransferase [Chlorobium limicola]|uniref:glycosyltransferase n=1 Tax=Chlorobium limicola TaxID=1092 RepID=UPI0023F04F70|nr:glycosyltransferase [Chlorobium limicola]NTV20912.1 glycosyltransferase [Chlorobium limicola]
MKKARHVVIAIPCLNRGGTEMQTLCLVKALVFSDFRVTVLCYFEYDRAVVDEYRAAGGDVVLMDMVRSIGQLSFAGKLRNTIAGLKPDVVHVQYMTPGALAIVAARLAGARRVLATVHQPYSSWHNPLWKGLLRLSALLCDHFIAVSLAAESSWFGSCRDIADVPDSLLPKHFTLHNAVDVGRVQALVASEEAAGLRRRHHESDCFVFGYIGRLSHEKGADIFFDAFELLAQRYAAVCLLVVGDGPERSSLEHRYGVRQWWRRVAMAGRQDWENAMRHFAAMDAVVVPSRFEGFGLSAVEAMAASLPVVASDAGGLGEIIANGQNGLLFECGNVSGLLACMERLLLEPETRRRLACDAGRRASDFDIELFNRKIRKLYNTPLL